jgi:hypothetical protein
MFQSLLHHTYLNFETEKGHKVDLLWLIDGGRGDVGVVPVEGGSCTFACIMQ